jgi:hypothetical protein
VGSEPGRAAERPSARSAGIHPATAEKTVSTPKRELGGVSREGLKAAARRSGGMAPPKVKKGDRPDGGHDDE